MRTIKSHTHKQRSRVVDSLLMELKKRYGENLLAVGADGSYARGNDTSYSDLELVAFVKKLPSSHESIREIREGMLVVVTVETKNEYIRKYLDVVDGWHASGTKLSPLINKKLIDEVNAFEPEDLHKKCRQQIRRYWPDFQEITAKVLNAIDEKNDEGFPLAFAEMVKQLLVLLSYLNETPYTTLGSYITEARKFKYQPNGFKELTTLFVDGTYQQKTIVRHNVKTFFSSMEKLCTIE